MKSDTKTRNTKKTIVRMLAAMLIGGVIGGVSTVVYEIVFGEDFSGRSLSLLTEVTRRLMVPGLLSVLVVSIAAYEICFKKLRNVCDRIEDAEDEEFHRLDYEEERYGAILQCINVVAQVLCIALLGSGYSMRYIHDGRNSLVKFLTACVLFLICFFYCGMAQARYVKLLQKVHPEKKGDIASKDFHKQWLESCDEAEKEAVYVHTDNAIGNKALEKFLQYLHILRKINRNIVSCDDDRAFIFQYRSVRDCCGRCNLFMYNCKILCFLC